MSSRGAFQAQPCRGSVGFWDLWCVKGALCNSGMGELEPNKTLEQLQAWTVLWGYQGEAKGAMSS